MIRMTWGQMPSREQFDLACAAVDPDCGKSIDDLGYRFGNDMRYGNDTLTSDELWDGLWTAKQDHEYLLENGTEEDQNKLGDWISCVLGTLGFEWV